MTDNTDKNKQPNDIDPSFDAKKMKNAMRRALQTAPTEEIKRKIQSHLDKMDNKSK